MSLDIRTLVLLNLIGSLVNLVALTIIWRKYRKRYSGSSWWLADMGLQLLAILLILLRGSIPDFISVVVANVVVQMGILALLIGLQRFFGMRGGQAHNVAFLALFVGLFTYWGVIQPNLNLREILLSWAMVWFFSQGVWLLLVRIPLIHRPKARMTALILGGYVVINAARGLLQTVFPSRATDFFHSGTLEGLAMLSYVTLSLFLMMSLVLMVTARLMEDVHVQEEKFSKAFHSSPNAVLLTREVDGTIFELNQGFEEISGWPRAEALSKTTNSLKLWLSDEARNEFIARLASQGTVRNVVIPFHRKNGEQFIGLISAERLRIGNELCIISTIGDITEQHRLQLKLEELATHDTLTGLANRRLFYDRFETALSQARRTGRKLAVVSLDLDRFKVINDTQGHETGDWVLVEAARRLSACLRGVDTVARFGGDEFVLLLWDIEDVAAATRLALKILEQFQIPFQAGTRELILHASLGIALYPDAGGDLATLLRKSDRALYEVKEAGRNSFRFALSEAQG